MKTLHSYFKLKDLDSISANLSLIHNGVNAPRGLTVIALYDTNKKIAAALYIQDNSAYSAYSTFYARYYNEDGSSSYLSSSTFAGDISGVCTIRYEPLRGIIADVPGRAETQLYKPNQINGERLIKYIAIQSYRYSSYTEHNEHIYDISLSYASSEYTVFHDNCNDMDNFQKDLTFGYGAVTNGTIEVPDGQSYMRLTSVAAGAGWHGPNYVYALDRPFRLYQLIEFSVLTGLNQGTASLMGKTMVGLFSENKECIMKIEWTDDGNIYTESNLYAYFYTQSGTEYNRFLWYGDGSMQIGVRMWWNAPSGGNGGIYVRSDVAPYDYLVGACDNVSRVVKYVVIAGQGYSSNPLLDMRIHDINVIAQPNRVIPQAPEPEISDGTSEGLIDGAEPSPQTQTLLDNAESASAGIEAWWTGWWPRLHVKVHFSTPAGGTALLHFSIDLLFAFLIEETGLNTPVDDQLTAQQQQSWALSVSNAVEHDEGPLEDFFRGLTIAVLLMFGAISASLLIPLSGPALTFAFVSMLLLWQYWITSLTIAVAFGWISVEFVVGLIGGWLSAVIGVAIAIIPNLFWFAALMYLYKIKPWSWLRIRLIWSVLAAGFQLLLASFTYYIWLSLVELSMTAYSQTCAET